MRGEFRQTRLAIVLDPGHGGDQYGNVQPEKDGFPAFVEKDANLALAESVYRELSRQTWPIEVTLTRWRDEFVGHAARASIAENAGKRVANRHTFVLSLHHDASPDTRTCGPRVYRMDGADLGAVFSVGFDLAHKRPKLAVIDGVVVPDKRRSWICKPGDWTRRAHVVMHRHDDGTLVECGYCTNDQDRAWLESGDGHRELVTALMSGLRDVVQALNPGVAI